MSSWFLFVFALQSEIRFMVNGTVFLFYLFDLGCMICKSNKSLVLQIIRLYNLRQIFHVLRSMTKDLNLGLR